MDDVIRLKGLRFQVCHGVLDHEKRIPQPFEVDVEMGCDLRMAAASDGLEHTINYGEVALVVARIMGGPPVSLLEMLAGTMATEILAIDGVLWVRIRVRKLSPPIAVSGGYAEVEVFRGAP